MQMIMEPAHFQAASEGNVNGFPFCNINDNNSQDMADIFDKVTPSGNSLLHVAASQGRAEIIELMVRRFPLLIFKKNYKGDTALHVAVRAGKLNTVKILVDCTKQVPRSGDEDNLLKMKNYRGNTALHEALLLVVASKTSAGTLAAVAARCLVCEDHLQVVSKKSVDISVAVARCLVSEDPQVSCYQNNSSKSPLCLAVESENNDILDYILKALPQDDCFVECLEGKSPVHVAIEQKQLDALRIIKEHKEALLHLRDEKGNTPLHCAASQGYFEGVRHLVENNGDQAFERNKEGLYPLHLACENGNVKVTQELIRKWPDPTELIGENGQSILHVAAKYGKQEVVRYLLKQDGIDNLINEMDKDGNTPFHLAVLHHHSMVVASLLWDKRLNPGLVNYQGLTAYEICQENMPEKVLDQPIGVNDGNLTKASGNADQKNSRKKNLKKSKQFQKMMTLSILFMYHEFFGRWCIKRHRHSSSTKRPRIKYKPQFGTQDHTNTLNNLFVVAALLVGAAFTAALQMPLKGDNVAQQDKDLLGKYVLTTIITMNLSIAAALTLCLALLLDTSLAIILVSIAFLLLELAFAFVGYAFYAATILTIKQYKLTATYDYIDDISIISVTLQTSLLTIPLLTLISGWEVLSLIIYFGLFCFYYLLYGIWRLICCNSLSTLLKIVIRFLLFGLLFFIVVYICFIF